MPPKPKFTKDEIIDAAYAIAADEGIDAVVARAIGKKLGSTATPIFTFFSSMDEVKQEVYGRAKAACVDYLSEAVGYTPAFKEFGLRWTRFAQEQPHLYKLLFLSGTEFSVDPMKEFGELLSPVLDSVQESFDLCAEDAHKLLDQMIVHANGIAMFTMSRTDYFNEQLIGQLLSEACIGLMTLYRVRRGRPIPEHLQDMANATARQPVKTS